MSSAVKKQWPPDCDEQKHADPGEVKMEQETPTDPPPAVHHHNVSFSVWESLWFTSFDASGPVDL